jgi:hypothetical protein
MRLTLRGVRERRFTMEPTTEPVVPTTEPVVEPTVEPVVEGQASSTTEPIEPTQVDPNEQFIIKTVVDGQEQTFDIRDAEQRKSLQENAQKGFHYNKKMQSLSEWEKANQAQVQFNQGILNNPQMLEISVAQQNGLDPSSLYGELKPPDTGLYETNPQLYFQMDLDYRTKMWQRNQIKTMTEAYGKMQADINNNALFERARIEHELSDIEFNQVKTFLTMNFRPNNYNMFTKEQMDVASSAIVGKSRQATQQMNTISKIDKSIKQASSAPGNVSVRNHAIAPSQKDTDDFHKFVREKVRS